jgi:hypothetical protein
MKRTVSRPPGPAIAGMTAHSSGTTRSEETRKLTGEARPPSADNRITVAALERHPAERGRGYDPYNANASPLDIQAWKRRQKPG